VSVVSGVASANPHTFQFFGCSQVCSDTDGNKAVVDVGDGYECRRVVNESDRNNVPWSGKTYCYEVSDGESIVAVLEEDEYNQGEGCALCLNPNNCAENYYDSAEQVLAELDQSTCGACESVDISIGGCTVYGSNGANGNGNGNGGNGNNGRGNGNNGRGNGNGGRGNGNGGRGNGNSGRGNGNS